MSVRLRIFSNFLAAMLTFNALSAAAGFLMFWLAASPYVGERLNENVGYIAARYFSMGSVVVLVLSGVGALWIIGVAVRHVTGPLKRLKKAASEIRDGNLGYELAIAGQDEFAELAASFEQMRIRLKDTMRMQERAEAERRAMMASITHDLKTPITSIMGYAEGIIDGVAGTPEKTREYAEVISKKARSLQLLSDDLSLLSRLENAQLPLDRQEEDVGALVSELASDYFHGNAGAKLALSLAPGVRAMLDREKIVRILTNLFQNSEKYKKPEQSGPELSITLAAQNSSALLTVSDNGISVAQSDLPRLFEQFYRADSSRGQKGGSGLGLSIARQLVNLHGGKIWIYGNPGGGLCVSISLPISQAPPTGERI